MTSAGVGEGGLSWRQIFGIQTDDFYAMGDWGLARKIGGALWLGGATIALLLFPLAPLDDASIGDSGWIVGGAMIVFAYGVALGLLRSGSRIGPGGILALNYVAVGVIVILMWLHGGFAPYTELLAMPLVYTAAVHPPRRTLVFVLVTGLALLSPLLYAPEQTFAEELARFLLWSGLAMAATVYTAKVRVDRQGLLALSDEARIEARLDPLTGLGHRRAFNEALSAATLRSSRTHTDLRVIIADLDSFKAINDHHGLPAGDRCLRDVAQVIDHTVRQPDSCFRWGGDEFVVVADVDREGAAKLSERLKSAVRDGCRRPDGEPVTLHIGAAQLGDDGADPAALLAEASAALKATGGASSH